MTVFGWVLLIAAVTLLNMSLTFVNIWPTLGIRATDQVSLEAAICALGLVLSRRWIGAASQAGLRALGALWVVLIVGRYIDVTAQSLYGRDINLYWDVRRMPDVVAMFASVAPWRAAAVLIGLVLFPLVLYASVRWALGRASAAAGDRRAGRR